MSKRILLFLCFFCIFADQNILTATRSALADFTQTDTSDQQDQQNIELPENTTTNKNIEDQRKIYLNFENEDLTTIINQLAELKKVNIILPQPNNNPLTQKITFSKEDPVTIDEAFNYLYTILDIAGYSLIPQEFDENGNPKVYLITKNNTNTNRETLRIFLYVDPETLPNSDERIRFVYSFTNIKVPQGQSSNNPLDQILKSILSDAPTPATIYYDTKNNSLIITDKSYNIKTAMKILCEFDQTGFREVVEVIPLYYTLAKDVALTLGQLTTKDQQQARLTPGVRGLESLYFSPATKIVAEDRTNALILMGRNEVIQRIKNFILTYIDRPTDEGESILHVYHLKYLKAADFGLILSKIIAQGGGDQSSAKTTPSLTRHFQDPIIDWEKPSAGDDKTKIGAHHSGNRLIITARKNDWVRIKKLIEELDQPQLQVALEVLIVDLQSTIKKNLGTQSRNKSGIDIPMDVNYQAANFINTIVKGSAAPTAADALKADLLGPTQNTAGPPDIDVISQSAQGSTLLSLKDSEGGGMWAILKIMDNYDNINILSHPFLITRNTLKATVSVGESRLSQTGNVTAQAGGAASIVYDLLDATLDVEITPIISGSSKTINLDIIVTVNNFKTSSSETRNIRDVKTNANVRDKEVLVLGGLTKTNNSIATFKTPVLGDIPFLGWLFKYKANIFVKDNLMIFICPTILEPSVGLGKGEPTHTVYTKEKLDWAKQNLVEGEILADLREPITRWFFKSPVNEAEEVDTFVNERFAPNPKNPFHSREKEEVWQNQPEEEQKYTTQKMDLENTGKDLIGEESNGSTKKSATTPDQNTSATEQKYAAQLKQILQAHDNQAIRT